MNKRQLNKMVLSALFLAGCQCAVPVSAAEKKVKAETQEEKDARIWQQEENQLQKDEEENKRTSLSLTGTIKLDKREVGEEEKANLRNIDIGTVIADGKSYTLRLIDPNLLQFLRGVPSNVKVNIQGKMRMNGKFFFADSAYLAELGTSAPPMRHKRGGI